MKFAEHLSAHITPEWRKQYIQYEHMKELLYAAIESFPSELSEIDTKEIVKEFERKFFLFCEKELQKIDSFFAEKLAEAVRKFNDLNNELDTVSPDFNDHEQFNRPLIYSSVNDDTETHPTPENRNIINQPRKNSQHRKQKRKILKKINDLKLAFSEFYLNLVLLQNYQTLNFTGFRKILKKHDKLLCTSSGNQWRQDNVDDARFYTCKDVDKLIEKTENIFTNVLEDGNRSRAMKRLRVPPLNAQQSLWTTFRVGFYSGVLLILCASLIIRFIQSRESIKFDIMCNLFRGPFYIWLFVFLLGINVYGWRTSGVNHVLIFELDPRDHISEQHLFEVSLFFAVIWALTLLGYCVAPLFNLDGDLFPLIAVIGFIVFLINPTKTFCHTARFWLLRVLYRLISAPFFPVTFADFWLADQLNSLTILYYLSNNSNGTYFPQGKIFLICRAICVALPAWFRFAQCLRRYRDDHFRKIPGDPSSSVFFYFWMASLVISSIYTYSWDVLMDWGLMNVRSTENCLLRNELVYSKPFYHLAYVGDFFGRTMWAFTISLNQVGNIDSEWLSSVVASIELFRLENEHLNNCGEFRAVRDISIAPINLNASNGNNGLNYNYKSGAIFKKNKSTDNNKPRRLPNQYSIRKSQEDCKNCEVSLLMDSKTNNKDYDKL
ncbi:Xenotropic and polytropic retrovirus receptor 1 [Sarcoptes scabiei]|uniref:Xenotropic and polytropic retrovirus receptor 1 n=1 Tax=Sarcoptes scabiei TaxID=52283 RepID=A0A834VEC9_SARSC|nr:Xenotropic and polytropic retrovirus receptor 1 [Sarcoptes scabiei]